MKRTVVEAGARGVVAAMAMTGLRRMAKAVGIVGEAPPDELARHGAGTAWVVERVPADRRDAVLELAHWGFGGVAGAGYGALVAPRTQNAWAGPAYGLGIWALFEVAAVPLLGLERSRGRPPIERAAIAADHLLYGLVLSYRAPDG